MAFGQLGSTLNDELNRLANGGTYRDMDDMVDEALAAKQWANRENIIPYSTDTVGILNEIAALGPNRQNWYDFNGVCNYLAGTTGLPAAAALRQITTTGDILTSLASYYVDAATPRYNYPGYVTFSGVSGNYILIPDSAALDVTGDIDVRVQVALDDWTPAATSSLIAKWQGGTNYSYFFTVETNGTLGLNYTTDGTAGTANFKYSSVATGIPDGATRWVRATRSSSTGNMMFYTSTDGSTWTQLGTTITSTPSAIYAGTSNVTLMSNSSGGGELAAGKLYNAQIFASLNGTDKRLDVDLTTNVTSATYNQFTATTGQLVTINGQDVLTNGGAAGSLLPTTVGSSLAADSNDAKFLAHDGTNYVYVPGTQLSNMSVPDGAAFDITGDIDLRAYVAMDDWTPSAISALVTKWDANQWSYSLSVDTNGTLLFDWSATGSLAINKNSTVATGLTDGTAKWVRATLDVDNGASGNTVTFYTSDNGTSWTQLGSAVTTAGVTSIYSGTANVIIGARTQGFGQSSAAKIYRAQIFNGIDGTKVLDVDTSVITTGAATSFTAVTGQTVTINRSTSGRKSVAVTQPTWLFGTDDYMEVNNRYMAHSTAAENYVYLSGAASNYMSISDNPPLDVTGDIDIQVKVALDDWTPAASQTLLAKYTAGNLSYNFMVHTSGSLRLLWSANGSAAIDKLSTVATGITDGSTKWVRVTLDVDNGASGNDVKFFTSDDGTTWTQLGSTVTTAGTTSIYSGSAVVEIGTNGTGTASPARGKFFRSIIKNGIDGTIVLDADASVITLPSQTTFVDRSSNAYTVTINKSGVGTFVSTGNYLYLPGINLNYASTPDAAALDIVGDIDLRAKVALDDWTPSAGMTIMGKWVAAAGRRSYQFGINATTGTLFLATTADGTTSVQRNSTVAPTILDGETLWIRVTLDVDNGASGNTTTFFTSNDGITWTQLGSTVVNAGTTSIFSSSEILEIGSLNTVNTLRGKFFRAQVLNGINGTLAFDANFESSITSLNQASFTESSTNGATVTINRSGSTFRSAGVIDAGYLYPGATNTFSNSTIDYLNFGATDSFSVLAVVRQWNTPVNGGIYISKRDGGSVNVGYEVYPTTSNTQFLALDDGPNAPFSSFTNATIGSLLADVGVVNRTTQTTTFYTNATTNTSPTSISTLGSLSNIGALSIGRRPAGSSGAGGLYQDFELIGAAVFRSALTAAQIRQISNYFANREAYL